MTDRNLTDLLQVAVAAARAAGKHTLIYFGQSLAVSYKADESPVTRADTESESILRKTIAGAFPHHAVLGEEGGQTGHGSIRWIIDPLDGTKSFVRGVPLYGVLVGVEMDGQPRVGAVYLPATDQMIAAADGIGCTCNGSPIRVSTVDRLEDATLTTTNAARCAARWEGFTPLARRVRMAAGWGDAYGHVMVAMGNADVMIDPRTSPWDLAALVPILTEAGGRLTDWSGHASIGSGDAVSTNGLLHPDMLKDLTTAGPDTPEIR
jgi:histidinol phosphatase-like enzyme (inositol monophosphatase family)